MLSQHQIRDLLQSPRAIAAEERFVRGIRKNSARISTSTLCFAKFVKLLAADRTFEEIASVFGIPKSSVTNYYEKYFQELFGNELGIERRKRLAEERRSRQIEELLQSPITEPLLKEIADIAVSQGCQVTSLVKGTKPGGKVRVSKCALYIDGKSCYVHQIHFLYSPKNPSGPPLSCVQFDSTVLLDFDVRILCARIPDIGNRNYVVSSALIHKKLFRAKSKTKKGLAIAIGRRNRNSRILDVRPFNNRFEDIKHY